MARLRKKTLANIYKLQTSFNRKVNRLLKLNRNNEFLPRTISRTELNNIIKSAETSSDVKREMKKLERFIKKGGERLITYEGTTMLQSDKETLISMRRSVSAKLRNEIKLELAKIGNPVTYERVMSEPRYAHFFSTELGASVERLRRVRASYGHLGLSNGDINKELQKLNSYIGNRQKWSTFRDNFIVMIKDMGYVYGIPESEINEVVKKLSKLNSWQFAQLYRKNDWLEQLIYGYHAMNEFGINKIWNMKTVNNHTYREEYLMDWEDFKKSIDIAINETTNDVDELSELEVR